MKMSLPGAPVRVVLRSAFADDEADFLEFVMTGDTVEMMETPWTRRLDDKVRAAEAREGGGGPSQGAEHRGGERERGGVSADPSCPLAAPHRSPPRPLSAQLYSYLSVYKSNPAFTAGITLDAFERSTISVAPLAGGGGAGGR